MRRFELFLVFGEVFAVAWPAVFGIRTRRGIIAGALVALFILHWQSEGLRWQMLPVYGTALGLAIGDIIAVERRLDWTRRIARGIFGLAGVGLAAVLPLIFPVPVLPVPSGPAAIGTITVELTDPERQEIYGPTPGGPRRLMAQVWYPASPVGDVEPVPWSEEWDIVAPEMATLLGFPDWFFGHTRYVDSHSLSDAPAAAGTFPLIIYSHGWTGFRTIAINQIETLASNGFMVVAVDHTYGSVATRFPEGKVVIYDPAALPNEEEVGAETYHEAGQTLVGVYADDLVTVMDAMEEGSEGPFGPISESADLTRIGIYGHSAGGGAAIEVCLEDERCDAVLGLDPWVEPLPDEVISVSASTPALYLRSDEWRGDNNDAILRGIAERSTSTTYWLGVQGAGHNDFVITPLISPIADELGLRGPIASGQIIRILDRYLVGFFDVFLLDIGPAALDTASFEEVSLEVIRPMTSDNVIRPKWPASVHRSVRRPAVAGCHR